VSIPPEALMKLMAGGGGTDSAAGPNPMSAAAPSNEAPGGGPMSTPGPKEGEIQKARVNISMVFQLLEQSLPAFGSQSEEGKSVLQALSTLTKRFGKDRQKADQLIPAELMQLVQSVPGMGGGTPAAQAMGGMPATQPAMPVGA
jgi:hypothetical protein